MKSKIAVALAALLSSSAAFAAVEKYDFDPAHSQIRFGYDHLGFLYETREEVDPSAGPE